MPDYEYRCTRCGRQFTRQMTIGEHHRRPRPPCPKCRSRRVEQRPSRFQALTSKKT